MKASIEPVTEGDGDEVYRTLLRDLNPDYPPARWMRLFQWGWKNPEDHVGWCIRNGYGEMVGFIGTIYGSMQVQGDLRPSCNFTSWIVKEGFRSYAPALLSPVLRRKDLVITNLTPTADVSTLFQRLKFSVLEQDRLIVGPSVALVAPNRGAQISGHPDSLDSPVLNDHQSRVFEDHRTCAEQFIIELDSHVSHVIFTVGHWRRIPLIHIHHVSNVQVFLEALGEVKRYVLRRFRSPLMQCDARILGNPRIPGAKTVRLPVPRLYRGSEIRPNDIHNHYSEILLLNLP